MSTDTWHAGPDLLRRYADGALDDVGQAAVEAHVERCADCRADATALVTRPTLEPVWNRVLVEVRTPEEYMGEVIGDLNSRRGQMQSMEDAQGVKVVRAHVPLSGMFGYIGDLRSKTQGRAVYSMTFNSYAEVPKAVADEIIQKSRGE